MKTVKIGALALVMMMSANAFAQKKGGNMPEKTPTEMAQKMTDKMTEELGLSADQKQKVYNINLEIANKTEEINDTPMTKDDRDKAIKQLNAERREKLSKVLTPEQQEKAKSMAQAKKQGNGAQKQGAKNKQ